MNVENASDKLYAEYEQVWVRSQIEDGDFIRGLIDEYVAYGQEFFNMGDGVPISLKALLWNRYNHWGGIPTDKESFRNWYRREYLKEDEKTLKSKI